MGRIFEPRVNIILNELERAVDELHQINKVSHGSIYFGCSHLPAFSIMPPLINKFHDLHPAVNITVIEGQFSELVTSLRLGRLDFFLGITSPEISMREFSVEFSMEMEFCVIARSGHPLIKSHSLAQLKNARWYLPNDRTSYYKELDNFIFPMGRTDNDTVIHGDSMSIAEQLVLNEDYLFVGPKSMLNVPYLKGIISMIPINEKLPNAVYALIYKQQQGVTPLAKQFIDEIKIACSEFFAVKI